MIRISEGPVKVRLSGDDSALRAIAAHLRVHPKGFEHAPTYKAFVQTDGREGWDGYISPIRIFDQGKADSLRGHKDRIIEVAQQFKIPLDLRECLHSPFEGLLSADIPEDIIAADFDLDQYQRESVAYWLANGMGVNKIAVNGGKTAIFAAAAAMIQRRFPEGRLLYVTQSERLVRQAYKDITNFLPGWNITQFGGSKKDNRGRDMVIATVAMLWANLSALEAEGWFATFIGLLYDESHHVASPTSQKLLMRLPCFFRLGASDTSKESDPAKADRIRGLLGPIRYTVPVETYVDLGRSAKPTIYLVENSAWANRHRDYPHQAEPDTPAWALVGSQWRKGTYLGPVYERDDKGQIIMRTVRELRGVTEVEKLDAEGRTVIVKSANWVEVEKPVTLDGFHTIQFDGEVVAHDVDSRYCLLERVIDKAIVGFKERNRLIVEWVKHYTGLKYPTLVVCTRTMHVLILEAMIKEAVGPDHVQVLFSDHTPKQRDAAFDAFRHTPGSVLISPLVKEGVSINEIKGGVIADYVGDWEVANQIIGRFIRKKKTGDNEAFITAFIDVQHPSLKKGSRRVYNRLHDIRGYRFYHPCLGPDSIEEAEEYKSLG